MRQLHDEATTHDRATVGPWADCNVVQHQLVVGHCDGLVGRVCLRWGRECDDGVNETRDGSDEMEGALESMAQDVDLRLSAVDAGGTDSFGVGCQATCHTEVAVGIPPLVGHVLHVLVLGVAEVPARHQCAQLRMAVFIVPEPVGNASKQAVTSSCTVVQDLVWLEQCPETLNVGGHDGKQMSARLALHPTAGL